MNILFTADVPLYFPTSGSEQVLNQQSIGLKKRGLNVFAITRMNGGSQSVVIRNVNGVKEACYRLSTKNILESLRCLFNKPKELYYNLSRGGTFSASISHQPFTSFFLQVNTKFFKVPLIYVFHSPSHEEYLLSRKDGVLIWKLMSAYVRKIIEGYCLKRANKIIVLSNYMKRKIIEIHKIKNELILINPGGADLDRFKPIENRNEIKAELGYSAGKIHLLTIRNLEPRMGLDNLLKGIYLIKRANVPIQLIIGGKGPEKERLQKIIKDLGILNEVTLKGFISSDKLALHYGAADFFILPTRDLEGFGLVTPESMACGTPVLGTPIGGTKEILENFDSHFLFQDTSPEAMAHGIRKIIDKYLKEKEKYNQLRMRCREFVIQNYSWKRHLDILESNIYELIES